jgi:enoyl-CoA hydratase
MHTIRMAHPGKNAVSSDLMSWLADEVERAGREPILLTGSGDAFSAGLDLKEVARLDTAAMERFLRTFDRIVARLFDHPAPVVAALNGHAIAGGCVLALCCDWRVATKEPRARIGINEVALGACYPPVTLRVVLHRLAPQHKERIVLGAGLFSSADALAVGLVDELADDVEAAAKARLEALSAHPRATYAHTKALLRRGVTSAGTDDERRFREHEVALWTGEELKQRIAAALQR